jgi:hypothetical protein
METATFMMAFALASAPAPASSPSFEQELHYRCSSVSQEPDNSKGNVQAPIPLFVVPYYSYPLYGDPWGSGACIGGSCPTPRGFFGGRF